MQAFAIPRLDTGFEGIHLVWSWPDDLPISIHGYDVQRLSGRDVKWSRKCETINGPVIAFLRQHSVVAAPLGPLRLREGATFEAITDPSLFSGADAGDHPDGFGSATSSNVQTSVGAALAVSPSSAAAVGLELDEFIQELTAPVERATVTAAARAAIAIALRNGKSVAMATALGSSATMTLAAPAIDTIIVYALSPDSIEICVLARPNEDERWRKAEVIAKNITLPIHECDPTLGTPAQELAAASSRLLGAETLDPADFAALAAALRPAAASAALGRSGERITLTRADAAQSYEELPLETQLGGLTIHPTMRRVLGFGFADRKGLVAGQTYMYRVTGRFNAADLSDAIYDVHRVPASTVLPASFSIRDVSFRFQTPVSVVLDPAPPNNTLLSASRRGIRIDTTGYDSSWLVPSYGAWSAIITLPSAVSTLVLEVETGHAFKYAAGLPWNFGSPALTTLPAGPRVELSFATPAQEIRLAGTGTLYAVRIPSGNTGIVEVHAYTDAVTYAAQPLPAAPTVATIDNLQQPPVTLDGPIDESTSVPPRPPAGFRVNWLPAASTTLAAWPNDLDAAPPLDAVGYVIEHRTVTPPSTYGAWDPLDGGDNLTVGSRDQTMPAVRLEYGCDLDALFPAVRPRASDAGFALHLSDVFGEIDPTTGQVRPAQPLGSYHQYRVAAMDAVGRVSATPTLSNIARLEKHVPPPLPAGPQPPPALDANGHLTGPSGPRARAIVKGAPGLTTDDVTLLGTHQNAILLEWGWRQSDRDLDGTAAEFRVYHTQPLDVVAATITSVSSGSPNWQLTATTDLPLDADELAGQWLTSGGYPFLIAQNDAGTSPGIQVEPAVLKPAQAPVTGPVIIGRPLAPAHQRPSGWDERVAVYPITSDENYRHVFYDVLTIDEAHPRASTWVGVSCADAQSYVSDERTTGANANRVGNESAIVTCAVAARYRGKPVFSMPAPLGDVPELVTDEPTGRQILVTLDLAALVGSGLAAGTPAALLRCSADDVLSRTAVAGGQVQLTNPDGTQQIIAFPNTTDSAAVLASLGGTDPQRLANRYLLHILAASSDPLAFFQRVSGELATVGPTEDRLAPKAGRFFYAVRAADSLGHLSDGGAVLPVVVRVPSTDGAAKPLKRGLTTTNTSLSLTVAVPADFNTVTAILFADATPAHTPPPAHGEGTLLRLPNRRDLYPLDGLRLRTARGVLLAPALAKSLDDADVTIETDGTRVATLTIAAAKGDWTTVWCYALTRDGFPSFACGPFSTGVGA